MTISLHNLSVGYDRHPAVHHVSGRFAPKELTAIVGPNGGGKSTLLKAIMGFLPPMSGTVQLNGLNGNDIAYLPQQSDVDRHFPLSVLDVVLVGLWPKLGAFRGASAAQERAAEHALEMVGMSSFRDRPIEAMSTGQWRRVLFARLILQDAQVLLLDEPFAGIDTRTSHVLMHVVENWKKEGRTVIAVMHDLDLVRVHFGQSIVIARELVAWAPTVFAMSEANLLKANGLAGRWTEDADACAHDQRLSA